MKHRIAAAGRGLVEVALEPGNATTSALIALCMYLLIAHDGLWPIFVFAAAGAIEVAVDEYHERRESGETEADQEVTS